jgi:hypothetical protein
MPDPPTSPLSFRLAHDKRARLRALADERGVTVTELLGMMVDSLLSAAEHPAGKGRRHGTRS